MHWLMEKLLGFDPGIVGEGDWWISWQNAPLVWVLVLVIIPLVLIFSYYFYRRESSSVSLPVRFFLLTLRAILIFVLLVIIFEPVLIIESTLYRESNIVILVDDSVSMGFEAKFTEAKQRTRIGELTGIYAKGEKPSPEKEVALDKLTRLQAVQQVLTHTYDSVLGKLAGKYKIKLYNFSTQLANRELPDLTKMTPMGEGTAIGDALNNVVNTLSGEPLAGIVLISDGASNVGSDPANTVDSLVARGNMVPIWAIPAGSTQEAKDIEVLKLQARDVSLLNDFVEFKFSVKSIGFDNETVPIILKEGDRVVDEGKVTLLGGSREQEVSLKYKPTQAGEYLCEVSVPVQPGELVKENNVQKHHLKVIDDKIKVLYVENYPRWEYRALKNALIRDPTIKAHCWLIESDPEFPQESSPGLEPLKQLSLDKKDLFNYDVVIIGDISPKQLADPSVTGSGFSDPVKIMENLTAFVSEMGGGIAFIAGDRYNPRTFKHTPFGDLLPVLLEDEEYVFGPEEASSEPFNVKLTAAGRASKIMQLETDPVANTELWEDPGQKGTGLPPFWWFYPVRQAKPGAEVLAEHPTRKNKYGALPIFATQWYGGGRVFFSAVDETWRWRAFIGDKYFYSFWSQVIQDLRGGRLMGSRRYNIKVERPAYFLGNAVKIMARIYDEDFKPLDASTFTAHMEIAGVTGVKDIDLKLMPNTPSSYEGTYKVTDVGNHWVWVGPEGLGKEKERAVATFSVTLPMREYENPLVNTDALESIAKKTKGALVSLYEVEKLPGLIKPQGKVDYTETKEKELWNTPLIFLLFLFAITAEWIIRKVVRLV